MCGSRLPDGEYPASFCLLMRHNSRKTPADWPGHIEEGTSVEAFWLYLYDESTVALVALPKKGWLVIMVLIQS